MKFQSSVDSEYNQLIIDLSRDFVAKTAPEELPLFRMISESYLKNPEKTLKEQKGRDEDLGFGAAEASLLMTPVILGVIKAVVKYLSDEITKKVEAKSSGVISHRIKRMFVKNAAADMKDNQAGKEKQVPALTSEQLMHVRQLSIEKARQLALSEDQAALLADSIVGSLTLTTR